MAYLSIAIGYVLGSFPSAYVVTRLRKGIDIRRIGSKNMGTMNVLREVGVAEAIVVFLLDAGKGIAAVVIARAMGASELVTLAAGATSVIGHDFPLFLGFRGGKGGATGLGILLFLMPLTIPFYFALTMLLFFVIPHFTTAYGLAFIVFPFISWFVYHSVAITIFALAVILSLAAFNIPTIIEVSRKGLRQSLSEARSRRQK